MKNLIQRLTRNMKGQRGQGMTEYIIIVALIAVSAIGVYALFGKTIRQQVAGLAGEVAGTSGAGAAAVTAASATASAAVGAASADKKMGSYGN